MKVTIKNPTGVNYDTEILGTDDHPINVPISDIQISVSGKRSGPQTVQATLTVDLVSLEMQADAGFDEDSLRALAAKSGFDLVPASLDTPATDHLAVQMLADAITLVGADADCQAQKLEEFVHRWDDRLSAPDLVVQAADALKTFRYSGLHGGYSTPCDHCGKKLHEHGALDECPGQIPDKPRTHAELLAWLGCTDPRTRIEGGKIVAFIDANTPDRDLALDGMTAPNEHLSYATVAEADEFWQRLEGRASPNGFIADNFRVAIAEKDFSSDCPPVYSQNDRLDLPDPPTIGDIKADVAAMAKQLSIPNPETSGFKLDKWKVADSKPEPTRHAAVPGLKV